MAEQNQHTPHVPHEAHYSMDERLSYLRRPMDSIVDRCLVLKNLTRVPCYSDPTDVVYYISKKGELIRNDVALTPSWELSGGAVERVVPHSITEFVRAFLVERSDFYALKAYRRKLQQGGK